MLYPFTAIVGQEEMKLALLLNAINPSIGGVLIEGEKGTAKSTAVRALASLLPPMEESASAMTVVELPINATEDRVVGSINLEKALQEGVKAFEPGILQAAHQNILYVDEVNLLDDHIVDILLDVAAMGVNTVEREGVSHSHPSRFILVGTMNPEEGDLRPQLLDRFGLSVMVCGEQDPTRDILSSYINRNKTVFPVGSCSDFNIILTAYDCRAHNYNFKLFVHLNAKWLNTSEFDSLEWTAADKKLIKTIWK